MKMTRKVLVYLITIGLYGCSNDKIELIKVDYTMRVGEVERIMAHHTKDLVCKSDNDYIATQGATGSTIRGVHVGRTRILISGKEDSQFINVNVIPRSDLYPTPCLDWGISKEELISRTDSVPYWWEDDKIGFNKYSTDALYCFYMFENNKLIKSVVVLKKEAEAEIGVYLIERYESKIINNVKCMIDAFDYKEASCKIIRQHAFYNRGEYEIVIYTPIKPV